MNIRRILGGSLTAATVAAAVVLFSAHAVKSSDHQDTYNLATRSNTSADITDVYLFPSPSNPANVVFVMNVSPLSPAGSVPTFDPTLMWQFKISHGAKAGAEDQIIQFGVNGSGAGQTITMYGPATPKEVATANTFVPQVTGTFNFNTPTQLQNGIKAFAGPRADPFFFDLFGFFTFLGDRHYAVHSSEVDPGPAGVGPGNALSNGDNVGAAAAFAPAYDKSANPATPSFNGFAAGTMSSASGGYACRTNPSMNTLTDLGSGFNVLSYVVEVPRALLTTGFASQSIHVWATVNSSTGS